MSLVLERLYQFSQQYTAETDCSSSSVVSPPSHLLQLIRCHTNPSILISLLTSSRYLEMQLKHRLLTAESNHEESPLESLILTQYEPTPAQSTDHTTSYNGEEKYTNSVVSYECNNEDLVHGGYGFEKEGLSNSLDQSNLIITRYGL
jgi:hypothetical protein